MRGRKYQTNVRDNQVYLVSKQASTKQCKRTMHLTSLHNIDLLISKSQTPEYFQIKYRVGAASDEERGDNILLALCNPRYCQVAVLLPTCGSEYHSHRRGESERSKVSFRGRFFLPNSSADASTARYLASLVFIV